MSKKLKPGEVVPQVVIAGGNPVLVAPIVQVKIDEPVAEEAIMVSVMFRKYQNSKTRADQLKGFFRAESGISVYVVTHPDAEKQPQEGEVWVCEVYPSRDPIARWNHKDGTPSVLVVGLPVFKINVPETIRFEHIGNGNLAYRVPQKLPGNTKLVFIPDNRRGLEPRAEQLWRVKASCIIHPIGVDNEKTIAIAVICEEHICQTVETIMASAWEQAQQAEERRRGPRLVAVA